MRTTNIYTMDTLITPNIPDPCPADWDEMTPTEQGRHCKYCDKEVVDLSRANFLEIQRKTREKAGEICVAVDERRVNYTGPQRMFFRRLRRFAVAAMLVFGTSLFSFATPAQAENCRSILTEFVGNDNENKTLQGRAVDAKTAEVIAFVRVIFYIDGDKVGESITDEKGAFTAEIPFGDNGQKLTMKFKGKDYYAKMDFTIGEDISFERCHDIRLTQATKEKKAKKVSRKKLKQNRRMVGVFF